LSRVQLVPRQLFPEVVGMRDEYDLQRFVRAQAPVYEKAIRALRRGAMGRRYMEFMFPRLGCRRADAGPGYYAIGSLDEANAYICDPLLGGRYRECVGALQRLFDASARDIFGDAGAKTLHASLTLFSEASGDEFLLQTMFEVWFDGLLDEATMIQLRLGS